MRLERLAGLCALVAALAAFCMATPQAMGQIKGMSRDGVWLALDRTPAAVLAAQPWIRPPKYAAVSLSRTALVAQLAQAPLEGANAAPLIMHLPMPDGSFARFAVVEAPIMEPGLAALFPDIRTYRGQGLDDPYATVRLDNTPLGFHAQILSPSGAVYIDPVTRGDITNYASYYKRDYTKPNDGWTCHTEAPALAAPRAPEAPSQVGPLTSSGTTLRTYRLACAADGEYTTFFGGTVALGQAAVVTAVNRVDGVYETELAVRMVLVANNSLIIYTDSATDPYTNNNGSTMLSQNQTTCDTVIGSANYDFGHVFSTGGGGVAFLRVICVNGSKAGGVTGNGSPTGDSFWIDYVAHEMGHQFGGNHSFNSATGSCGGGNRNASTAYETGSGSSIMAYAGICGADDLQPHSDPTFHSVSLDEIVAYTTTGSGNGCAVQTSTGNSVPTVSAGANFTIPANTPFALTATGSDANSSDVLTYAWEERDLGVATTITAADNGTSPRMRPWNPTTSPTRIVPRLSNLLANTTAPGEQSFTVARTSHWRVVIRDNRTNGGGFNTSDMTLTVNNTGAAFAVTSPNTAVTWSGAQTVTWNVAGTTAAPISCANVKISLSTDGGNTWPTVLLASTPNSGSAGVTLPSINTSTARIKVEAVGNIFFDVSNTNFTITGLTSDCNTDGIEDATQLSGRDCNANGTLDVCDTIGGAGDCNTNRTPDSCELPGRDCNANGALDVCDTIGGVGDCNTNRTPDSCELPGRDCNANNTLDVCDTVGGAGDCNTNRTPDSCELPGHDCNANSTLDVCDSHFCPGDMNNDTKRDGQDVELFVTCLISGTGNCTCGDFNASGTTTPADLTPFVAALLAGTACP